MFRGSFSLTTVSLLPTRGSCHCSVLQRQLPQTKIQVKLNYKSHPTAVFCIHDPRGSPGHLAQTLQGSRMFGFGTFCFLLTLYFAGFGLASKSLWPSVCVVVWKKFSGQLPVLNACWLSAIVRSWCGVLVALFCPLFL